MSHNDDLVQALLDFVRSASSLSAEAAELAVRVASEGVDSDAFSTDGGDSVESDADVETSEDTDADVEVADGVVFEEETEEDPNWRAENPEDAAAYDASTQESDPDGVYDGAGGGR